MKKIIFLLSLIFAYTYLGSVMLYAQEVEYGPFSIESYTVFEKQAELSALANRENGEFKTEFRDVIDNNSQMIYDCFVENYDNLKKGADEITFTLDKSSGFDVDSVVDSENLNKALVDICYALGALDFDKMEFYWFKTSNMLYYISRSGRESIKITIKPKDGLSNYFIDAYSDVSEVDSDISKMEAVINEVTSKTAGKSYYEQILYFNDFLIKKNEYNRYVSGGNAAAASPLAYEPVSSLVYGSTDFANEKNPVCEGYSRGMKMLCEKAGIDCILVSGQNHMWNAIKMEDGRWYNMDTTYNDPVASEPISDSVLDTMKDLYTLVGTDDIIGGKAFLNGHTPDGSFLVSLADICTYPQFSNSSYESNHHSKLILQKVLNDDFVFSSKMTVKDLDGDNVLTASDAAKDFIS